MTIRVALNHRTTYKYDRLINLGPHLVRLRPAPHCRTPIHSYSLNVSPKNHYLNWQQDPFGNFQARAVFEEKTRELSVEVDLIAEMTVINPFEFFVESSAEMFPFEYDESLRKELAPFLEVKKPGAKWQAFIDSVDISEVKTVDFIVALNARMQTEIDYEIRMEPGVQTPDETLELKKGSCRDTGWLLVQTLRHLGLAARFVSGYLIQLTPDLKSLDGPSGTEVDFTDLHAWAEVFLPGAGWVGLDPTSGLLAGEGHIPLACTPEPSSAAPISGALDKCEVEFEFSMTVTRVHEDPRVTKPYTESQWAAIDKLGQEIDKRLADGDVRLTMGGEPTFVSIDDMEGEEWNSAAVGPNKRRLSEILIKKLRSRFATGAFLHYGQGKWYPGESLPRWALGCYWRKDGVPVWN
ncbi:MAG: transglutaminase family protein, partial [Fuerstiella sp.]